MPEIPQVRDENSRNRPELRFAGERNVCKSHPGRSARSAVRPAPIRIWECAARPSPQRPLGRAEVDGACGGSGSGDPSHREIPLLPAAGWPRLPPQWQLTPEAWIKSGFRSGIRLIISLSPGIDIIVPTPSLGRDAEARASSFGRGYWEPSRVSLRAGRTSQAKPKREI